MSKPPKQQYYVEKTLKWRVHIAKAHSSYMEKLLFHVRGVRNNLFHGAKFIEHESEDPARDAKLVNAASVVLGECLRVAPEIHTAFYADP